MGMIVGRRITFERNRREMTQAELASGSGLPLEMIQSFENGDHAFLRTAELLPLAKAMRVPITELTGDAPSLLNNPKAHELAVNVRVALIERDFLSILEKAQSAKAPESADNAREIELLWEMAHKSDYTGLSLALPDLLRSIENATIVQEARLSQLSDIYQLAAAVMAAVGQPDVAWVCADRAAFAAERIGDKKRTAASHFRLGHAFLRSGEYEDAVRAADTGSAVLGDNDSESIALRGALALVAAIAHSRMGNMEEAVAQLSTARVLAEKINKDFFHTEFLPDNVRVHEVGAYVELGMPQKALQSSRRIRDLQLSIERRSRFHIDIARAYFQLRDYHEVAASLDKAFALAPEGVRQNWFVIEILHALERMKDSLPGEIRSTVDRIEGVS